MLYLLSCNNKKSGWKFFWYRLVSDELNSDRTASFKCTTDGLFEDENNCQMYYECLWVGTMFEKQEHVRCPRKLIYNPRKHRCDNIFEFENQFANGIQTGEELIEFMRFRNCIGTRNLVIGAGGEEDAGGGGGATISDDTTQRPYNTNEDPYYSVLVANTSPPTDYWPPKLYLFDEGAQANTAAATDDTTTTTSTTTSTEPITRFIKIPFSLKFKIFEVSLKAETILNLKKKQVFIRLYVINWLKL